MRSAKPDTTFRLIQENQGLVFHLASRIHRTLPVRHEYDDLVGYGMVGLTQAAKAYVPQRKVKFSTFAFFRIRGAIFDGIAEGSWMTRAQYRLHVKRSKEAQDQSREEGTPDSESENDWTIGPAEVVELTKEHVEQLADDSKTSMAAVFSQRETTELLCLAVDALPRREHRLITLVYFEDISLTEAADRLGISKSWASRLHAKIIKKLGSEIKRANKEPDLSERSATQHSS